ncbi:sigma-B regulation protein RsbU (phosphoserine phosphatase) [Alkalibacillus flavidus]|uniref:Sigma-B regulation protein RsbU (Phosphoserine phosphatase) n=1 Tax=Alkalibacillus flavidus TaxID=546021 RepID=A0ABV2KYS7_9BACI
MEHRKIIGRAMLYESAFNALEDQIAIIDANGTILTTNSRWNAFCLDNGGDLAKCGVGINYLNFTDEASYEGILNVLNGEETEFHYEYPCHAIDERRWFDMVVTPLSEDDELGEVDGAVIAHRNITSRKQLELSQKSDLELAENLQQNVLLPPIDDDHISIEGLLMPSDHLSGDMYAWYQIDDHRYGVMLLDVMGHGVSSGLISMSLRSLLRGIITRVSYPNTVFDELNEHFCKLYGMDSFPKLYFSTGIYLLIDTNEQTIQYFNCGHPSGLIFGQTQQLLTQTSIPIGINAHHKISNEIVHYEKGDRIILYTDGLYDSLGMTPKQFERYVYREGISKLVSNHLSEELFADMEQADDISVVSIKL